MDFGISESSEPQDIQGEYKIDCQVYIFVAGVVYHLAPCSERLILYLRDIWMHEFDLSSGCTGWGVGIFYP